jgi:hypothetical protein
MTEVTRERVRPSLSLYLLILHPVPTNRSAPSLPVKREALTSKVHPYQ